MGTTRLYTYEGRKILAEIICGLRTPTTFQVAYGTGSGDAAVTDTHLTNEIDRAEPTIDTRLGGRSTSFIHTFTIGSSDLLVTEVGLFTGVAGTPMICRQTWDGEAKSAGEEMAMGFYICHNIETPTWGEGTLQIASANVIQDRFGNYGSPVPAAFTYLAYGIGIAAENHTHTVLSSESARMAATIELISVQAPFDTIRYSGVFPMVTSEVTISEVGVFNDASAGTMLWRDLRDVYTVISANSKPVVVVDVTIGDVSSTCGA